MTRQIIRFPNPAPMKAMADQDQALREEAFKLLDEGWTSEEVAELLEIKKMTVAGWMSWRTRGHYDEAGSRERTVEEVRNALRLVK